MAEIHYQHKGGGTYRIDPVSQRLLVYLLLHGETPPKEAVDPIGVSDRAEIHSRFEDQLGPNTAGLIEKGEYTQQRFSGEQEDCRYQLTESGTEFVYEHKATLSMPADLADLAKKVAEIRVEQDELIDLQYRVEDLAGRVADLEEGSSEGNSE